MAILHITKKDLICSNKRILNPFDWYDFPLKAVITFIKSIMRWNE